MLATGIIRLEYFINALSALQKAIDDLRGWENVWLFDLFLVNNDRFYYTRTPSLSLKIKALERWVEQCKWEYEAFIAVVSWGFYEREGESGEDWFWDIIEEFLGETDEEERRAAVAEEWISREFARVIGADLSLIYTHFSEDLDDSED